MGFTPYIDRSSSHGVSFCSQIMCNYLKRFGLCDTKYIPKEIKALSVVYLKILFDALMICDGTKDGRSYSTTSKQLRDDFQEICLKLGYSTTTNERKSDKWKLRYDIYISETKSSRMLKYAETFHYKGTIHCVDVENHLIFVKRNGKTSWCGNCDMGGAGYIFTGEHDADIMSNSALININIAKQAIKSKVKKLFFSSSACIYPQENQTNPNNPNCAESTAYPANPDSEYGWEKIFSERLYLSYARNYGLDVRIARFHNIFGPEGSWNNGKEKAPAAICRKIAEAKEGGDIEIWGDGEQTRSFLYIDECLEGVRRLMEAPKAFEPLNIGSEEMVTINQLATMIMQVANKNVTIKHIEGPLGVRGRCSDNLLIIQKLGWSPNYPLRTGLKQTYEWINKQVNA
jgi:nucleoside-diphosphate-sugar epimerase